MSIALDSSVLVAALVPEQDFHSECRQLLRRKNGCLGYSHGCVEVFSILTGGRLGVRVRASEAEKLLGLLFDELISPTALSQREMMKAFSCAESRGVRGGAVYDYLHLVAARKAKAEELVTLNLRDFQAFWRPGDPVIRHPEELA